MSTIVGNYFVLANLRNVVDIDDTLDDPDLKLFGNTADQDITNDLFEWANELPFAENTDLFNMAKNAALYKVAALWKAKKENDNLAKFYNGQYKEQLENIKKQLRLSPKEQRRSKRASVRTDYTTKALFSQTKKK